MIILPSWLIVQGKEAPRPNWGVRILNDKISDVAPNSDLRKKYPKDQVLEADGRILSPGFVNTHTHLYGVLAHGIPLDKAPDGFWPFLQDFWWPNVEDRLDQPMIEAATAYQCSQMIRSGVTTFYDCLEAPNALPGCLEAQAVIVRNLGLRGILSFEATERSSLENGQKGLQENVDFIVSCQKTGGLVSGMMCFHTTFSCSADFIQKAFVMAANLGVSVHMHCSEGSYEPDQALANFGMRPIHYYDYLGVTGSNMLASQCVHLDAKEIALIAKRGIRVSHMPLSNCEVGGGIAPVPQLLKAGVTVGLGSDGYIDEFFDVMRGAFLIHKANQQDPRVMPADLVWYLATEGGAKVLGLEKIGRIEVGWQADLQLIFPQLPTPLETWNLYDQLVLYGSQNWVETVLVSGRLLVKDYKVENSDITQLRKSVFENAQRLWNVI